jgi:EpsI family protein
MTRRIILVSIVLVLSFSLRMWVNAAVPPSPSREGLGNFPKQVGSWTMTHDEQLGDSIAGVLRADDYVLRSYRGEKGQQVDFFVAYYKVQKAGESMHSPKNCLPGWGWTIMKTDYVPLDPTNKENPILINRYLIEKGQDRSLVLYWYQANGRVIASEYWGKIYLVLDALRTGRRDGSIVRFVVPIAKTSDGEAEMNTALSMARETLPLLPRYLPN